MSKLAERVATAIRVDGGITINRAGHIPALGWAVAEPDGAIVPIDAPDLTAQVDAFLDRIVPSRLHIGAWVDRVKGIICLDHVQLIEDRKLAEALGRFNRQDAIYCLETRETVNLVNRVSE